VDTETKNCQNCKKDFTIEPEDFKFYEKINVPAPTWCPECRAMRRFSFMNVWSLYKRICAKCGGDTLSVYSLDKPNIVYCNPCWWGDSWDGREYGMDYDPTRSFFDQLYELFLKTPWQALDNEYVSNKNSKYVNGVAYQKDCYMNFWADFCENVFYSSYENHLKDSVDCLRMIDSELCYESIGCNKCYRAFFSEECDSCTDVWFSRACSGLVNCFGCINLRNKSYCIWNEQYTREDYFKKLKEFSIDSRKMLDQLRKTAFEFWMKYPNRFYIGNSLNVNVSGNYIYESKNTHDSYLVLSVEDSRFVQFVSVASTKGCYDYTGWGNGVEKIYESSVVGEGANNIRFSHQCWPDVLDIEYSIYANACKNVFGCVNLKKKKYCILNKEYTKEEYEKLKNKIIEDMKKNPYIDEKGRVWAYGEFLPLKFAPFAYNETIAGNFFPMTEEEALNKGFKWQESKENEYKITKKTESLPDTILETEDSILNDVFACSSCDRAYRFTLGELNLMKKLSLPLPRECFNCRQSFRLTRVNLPKLYERDCQKCGNKIKTSYAPDRPEIVYCVKCYQQEFA